MYENKKILGPEHVYTTELEQKSLKKTLLIAIVLVFIFMVIEFIGGIISGSVALIADASHMLSDFFGLALSLVGLMISQIKHNYKNTYGYSRAQVVVSLINALFLVFISVFISVEALQRFRNPSEVNIQIMLPVAIAGLLINFLVLYILNKNKVVHTHAHSSQSNSFESDENAKYINKKPQKNLLLRGATIHVISDLLGSVAAITAALIIHYTGWLYADPILSILIVLFILRSTYIFAKDSVHILMEGTPKDIVVSDIKQELEKQVIGIIDVHHMHIWMLTESDNIITLHLTIENNANATEILKQTKKILKEKFNLWHSTVQIETKSYTDEIFNVADD